MRAWLVTYWDEDKDPTIKVFKNIDYVANIVAGLFSPQNESYRKAR